MSKPWIFFGTKVKSLKNILSINGNSEINSTASTNLAFTVGGSDRMTFDTSVSSITTTLPYRAPDGTASLPSYSFSSDSNTGMYWIGADNFGFATAGTSVGNVSSTGAWTFGTTATNLVHTFNGSTSSEIQVKRNTATASTGTLFAASAEVGIGSLTSTRVNLYASGAIHGFISTAGAWSLGHSSNTASTTHTATSAGETTLKVQSNGSNQTARLTIDRSGATGFSDLRFSTAGVEKAVFGMGVTAATDDMYWYTSAVGGNVGRIGASTGEWTLGNASAGGSATHTLQSSGSTTLTVDASNTAAGQSRLALKPGSSEDAYIKNEVGNNLNFENNSSTVVGKYTAAGAWTFGASGGTQTHTINGSLSATALGTFTTGVKVKDTGAGSTTLSHYEEGTWTPSYDNSPGGTFAAGTLVGHFTRIGRIVHAYLFGPWTGAGGAANNITIGGLPYTIKNTSNYFPHGGPLETAGVTTTTGDVYMFQGTLNTTNMRVVYNRSGASSDFVKYNQTTGSGYLLGEIVYYV